MGEWLIVRETGRFLQVAFLCSDRIVDARQGFTFGRNDGREGCSDGAGVHPLARLIGRNVRMTLMEVTLYSRTNFDKMGDIVPCQTNERFVVGCIDDFPC